MGLVVALAGLLGLTAYTGKNGECQVGSHLSQEVTERLTYLELYSMLQYIPPFHKRDLYRTARI